MCDTALSFVRDHFFPFLKKTADMISAVPKEIIELKEKLESINDFINKEDKIADDAVEDKNKIKARIKQLIEISFLIEDVIDEYIFHEEHQSSDPGCGAAVEFVKTKILHFKIARKIQHINSRITEIKEKSEKDNGFHIPSSWEKASSSSANKNASLLQNYREASLYMDEADVVGFENPRDKLIDLLVEGREERTVVSIVGMGGLGKTTLAKKVFDNQMVVKHFDCHIWITVSRPYNTEKVLREILLKICKEQGKYPPQSLHQMDRNSLVNEVRHCLQEKRYVVVFDDVWDSYFCRDIEFAMIDNKKGSRLLITTRNKDVADACENFAFVTVHELKSSTKEQSLKLFNKKAFRNLNGLCPKNLIDISSKIVEKCKGLPLAVVVTGSLLSSNRDPIEWCKFSEHVNAHSKLEEYSMIRKILGLSYHDLPSNLKSCFLYFGLYPEDYKVHSKILTRQWIAEGFVKEDSERTLEEVAEGYLKELIRRSLVQVDSISIDGRVKSCGVHDLVHAMIIEKCEDLNFCKNIIEGKQLSFTGMIRRLSIATNSDNPIEGIEKSHVRSLLIFELQTSLESFVRAIPKKYSRLKVLTLRSDQLEIPHDLGSLNDLKYFGYSTIHKKCSELPKSIGMLMNLETLDLRNILFKNCNMPKEICKLRKLRHFLGLELSLIQLKDGIGGMTSLQTLNRVSLDDKEDENDNRVVELIEELGKLDQLRELVLEGVRSKYMSALSSSINKMQQLEKLLIAGIYSTHTFIDLDLNSPPPKLQRVTLSSGFLKKLPEWISKLQNLVKLEVSVRNEVNDAMKLLQSMPNLLSLDISGGNRHYEDKLERLHFEDGWFMNLKELELGGFYKLSDILIDEGALGSLKKLTLSSIPQLMTLPTGIQHLQKLESLLLMSRELKQSIAPDDEGKEHWIFNQVPSVQIMG